MRTYVNHMHCIVFGHRLGHGAIRAFVGYDSCDIDLVERLSAIVSVIIEGGTTLRFLYFVLPDSDCPEDQYMSGGEAGSWYCAGITEPGG